MLTNNPVILSKLTPPRLNRRILKRSRVISLLMDSLDYRLTILQAGAGYGKSTALACLADKVDYLAWYHLSAEDADPVTFFLHLIHTFKSIITDHHNLVSYLENQSSHLSSKDLERLLDEMVNRIAMSSQTFTVLVLDDFHKITGSNHVPALVDHLIAHAPNNLHLILSARHPLQLPSILQLKARGEVSIITQHDLAFTPQEISSLFHDHYSLTLSAEEIQSLASETEGWAIALQLFGQSIKRNANALSAFPLRSRPLNADELFSFLVNEVFQNLSPDLQDFLKVTSILRDLNPTICDCLRGTTDSEKYLKFLVNNGLFVVELSPDSIRYHHLFREFIQSQLAKETLTGLNKNAAACLINRGMIEEAIYHYLKSGMENDAARAISQYGENLIISGRVETLNTWITSLSPSVLEAHPILLVLLGDFARLHSRFEEALGWYRQAEKRSRALGDSRAISQALHGQAKVFLDTVNPSQAEKLLQAALQIIDGTGDRENRAHLLELLAENKLNSGQVQEAEIFQKQAKELRDFGPGETELSVRVLLRTGKLDQARSILETRLITEQHEPFPTARAHRETLLLLALILEFQGEWETAALYANEGIQRGEALQSLFVIAVGKLRAGHASLLTNTQAGYQQALSNYHEVISIADNLAVPRLKVEAFWGLSRAHGFKSELALAEQAALTGIEHSRLAGDEWISALIQVTMGASYVIAEQFPLAHEWLEKARDKFNKVNDNYGENLTRLWQCYLFWRSQDFARLNLKLDEVLTQIRDNQHEYLLTKRTFLGPIDPRALIPMLIYARDNGIQRPFIETILYSLGLSTIENHPGYQLRVQTLGQFCVWRGMDEILPAEWRREKSRQLFQLLVTRANQSVERDQLVEALWQEVDIELGRKNFRVTLSTLFRVLHPNHARDTESMFISRDGLLYALNPKADVCVDALEFERLIDFAGQQPPEQSSLQIETLQKALALYGGDYLQENPYEDWFSETRSRLLQKFLGAADRLAHLLADRLDWKAVLEVCQQILTRDNCWEEAYRLTMIAYSQMGNQPAALRAYQKCVDVLRSELEIEPSSATLTLFKSIFPNPPLIN